jgi:trafficking protein particle complex subunit 1
MGAPSRIGENCAFRSFQTDAYKLHYLESPSGLKFVLTTDPGVGNLHEHLEYIYSNLFVELVVKNPVYTPGEAFLFETFSAALNKHMRSIGLSA